MPYQQLIVNSVKSKASQRPLIKTVLTSFKCFHFLCSQGERKTESIELRASLYNNRKIVRAEKRRFWRLLSTGK